MIGVMKRLTVLDIYLVVKGTSKAAWSRSAPTMPYIRVYTGKEKVFELQIDIFKELKGTFLT